MEISPVAGIRVMAQPKARPVDPELTALFDIEAAARPGDDSYTGNRRKAAGAEEPEEDSEELEETLDDDLPPQPIAVRRDDGPHSQINFFA